MSIETKVMQIVAEQLDIDLHKVTVDSRFVDDLAADSLDTVELVMRFEREFNIEIPDTIAENIKSVKDAIEYIKSNNTPPGEVDDKSAGDDESD